MSDAYNHETEGQIHQGRVEGDIEIYRKKEIGHPGGGQAVTNMYIFNYSEQNTGFTGIYMPDLLRSEAHLMIHHVLSLGEKLIS
jgi:hypothetical protein